MKVEDQVKVMKALHGESRYLSLIVWLHRTVTQ